MPPVLFFSAGKSDIHKLGNQRQRKLFPTAQRHNSFCKREPPWNIRDKRGWRCRIYIPRHTLISHSAPVCIFQTYSLFFPELIPRKKHAVLNFCRTIQFRLVRRAGNPDLMRRMHHTWKIPKEAPTCSPEMSLKCDFKAIPAAAAPRNRFLLRRTSINCMHAE